MFEETLILDWFIQLTTAIKYIHDRRILHRDLKTRYGYTYMTTPLLARDLICTAGEVVH